MDNSLYNQETLVLHVKEGYAERATHIESMLKKMQIQFKYILDGDKPDLTKEVLDKYFGNGGSADMYGKYSRTSCAYKHILAYEYIVNHNIPGALILEDDIILHHDFVDIFNSTMAEVKKLSYANFMISYEDSRLRFVPRSKRTKGIYLYPGNKGRMTGAYYIDQVAAKCILDKIKDEKCIEPIDILHEEFLKKKRLTYFWCQPTIASQGSFTGLFKTSISSKKQKCEKLQWLFKLHYKKMLYFFR
jgi:Glycosyltransferase involved in LPS biosynthesis